VFGFDCILYWLVAYDQLQIYIEVFGVECILYWLVAYDQLQIYI